MRKLGTGSRLWTQHLFIVVTYIYVCERVLFLLSAAYPHRSLFPLYILFLFRAYSYTSDGGTSRTQHKMWVNMWCWEKKGNLLQVFYDRVHGLLFILNTLNVMAVRCEGSSLDSDKEYTECRAGLGLWNRLCAPVRSSLFPGPGVYVRGAITHRVPWLPLSAFCVLWPSPLPYSCCLHSFPVLWLEETGVWGKRMKGKRPGSSWDEVGSCCDMGWSGFLS